MRSPVQVVRQLKFQTVVLWSRSVPQVIRFAFAGGVSAVFEFGLFMLLTWQGMNYLVANPIALACSIVLNYFISIIFVFEQGRHSRGAEFAYFMLTAFLLATANQTLTWFFIGFLGIGLAVGKSLVIFVLACTGFLVKKHFIFLS